MTPALRENNGLVMRGNGHGRDEKGQSCKGDQECSRGLPILFESGGTLRLPSGKFGQISTKTEDRPEIYLRGNLTYWFV